MDKDNEHFPVTAREAVMIYHLLDLERMVEHEQSQRKFLIFPISSEDLKRKICDWISEQHKLLRESD
ncbi:MAG: hypothetical protein EHM34_04080 [Nitrosopumilales archaeon]|nr:MAG: hypothetical protein EHM34_04080 [Nitrosopumilales archaeon]